MNSTKLKFTWGEIDVIPTEAIQLLPLLGKTVTIKKVLQENKIIETITLESVIHGEVKYIEEVSPTETDIYIQESHIDAVKGPTKFTLYKDPDVYYYLAIY